MDLPRRIIPNKASSMPERSILVVSNIGINQLVDQSTILRPESNGNVGNGIARSKLLEYLQYQFFLSGTEVHDGFTDVFLGRVSEDVELSLVRP
jgi:hypothetical protein